MNRPELPFWIEYDANFVRIGTISNEELTARVSAGDLMDLNCELVVSVRTGFDGWIRRIRGLPAEIVAIGLSYKAIDAGVSEVILTDDDYREYSVELDRDVALRVVREVVETHQIPRDIQWRVTS